MADDAPRFTRSLPALIYPVNHEEIFYDPLTPVFPDREILVRVLTRAL